jgi:hypothetical protein
VTQSIYIAGRLRDLDPIIFEAMCVHELFLRMGFPEEAMSVESAVTLVKPAQTLFPERIRDGQQTRCLRVRLFYHGRLWVGAVGPCSFSGEELEHHWRQAREAFNGATPEEGRPLWENSRARKLGDELAKQLSRKGITPPVYS